MANVNVYFAWLAALGTRTFNDGSKNNPISIALANGLAVDLTQALVQNTPWTAWQTGSGNDPIGSFNFGAIYSDQTLQCELTVDLAGSAGGPTISCFQVVAGVPFFLSGNGGYSNYTANFAGGTLKNIDRIRLNNTNSTTANVKFTLLG